MRRQGVLVQVLLLTSELFAAEQRRWRVEQERRVRGSADAADMVTE